jgi:transposase-like protein
MNARTTSPSHPPLARSSSDQLLRLRPAERPQWLEAPVAAEVLSRWRSTARAAGLPVDAWVALLLELELVVEDLSELYDPVLEHAVGILSTPRLAFGDARRRWVRQLTEGSAADDSDELPSLALPARLLARVAPSEQAARFQSLERGDLDAAKTLDLAALAEGMTMEAWAYRCALRLARR